jgi:hypothetical protein
MGLLRTRTLGDVSASAMNQEQAKRLADERKVSHVQDCFAQISDSQPNLPGSHICPAVHPLSLLEGR